MDAIHTSYRNEAVRGNEMNYQTYKKKWDDLQLEIDSRQIGADCADIAVKLEALAKNFPEHAERYDCEYRYEQENRMDW